MKNLFVLLLLIIGALSSSAQDNPKTKNIDRNINVLLDSLSKVYRVKVGAVIVAVPLTTVQVPVPVFVNPPVPVFNPPEKEPPVVPPKVSV